jgi:hypothetical protein
MADESNWRPDYYAVTDYLVAENNLDAINAYSGTEKFIHSGVAAKYPRLRENGVMNIDPQRSFSDEPKVFNDNPISGIISGGGSVLVSLIQMAYLAGCRNIYLVGVDFSFEGGKASEDELSSGDKILISEGEVNHFHPDYRQPGETWTVPKYDIQRNGFRYAKEALAAKGVKLINASRATKLEVLERVNFDEQFPSKNSSVAQNGAEKSL